MSLSVGTNYSILALGVLDGEWTSPRWRCPAILFTTLDRYYVQAAEVSEKPGTFHIVYTPKPFD